MISKLTATCRVMVILTTEDPTLAFRNQPKLFFSLTFLKIDPKTKNFNVFFSPYIGADI